ncbi:helix-turn-helix domain-containing protein [Lentilactobacillus buchneri]|uniref:AraC family transcriptional regulator n=1 Tax=Lentilactobacillus buchneri subsp. silagei CD034 TaxID=1071400 RepID=J9W6H6_LENBU|nr:MULTISPECIES: helix-turn-helix domain-containing protein [Lentilactobacillus]MCC6101485.1 helix-turn-helix domain-containing protein [Lactobacillus sp.]AFS01192.1 AraC family transcriptional regulator [Lentilactobacillus buchneri subsp. silagei CD034]MCT2901326.1 helix-turn-helix domain-containing protein [Lentilactobacillus buchneri]MCT3541712.1 helix-turn-helix domain-containing protein [Lentilactobacillus buchneri]MCT3543897.1 helix-turn-helix domain-containing protein [Lentilactobacillu
MLDTILNTLMKPTKLEKEQLKSLEFHNDLPIDVYDTTLSEQEKTPIISDALFKNKSIYVSKHNRYAPYPTHAHTFLEINYMLRGSCDEVVEGQQIHLEQGDVLLLDVGCKHSVGYLGTNDLLINVLFRDKEINLDLLSDLRSSKSVLYEFLLNRRIGDDSPIHYLVFGHEDESEVQETLDRIIEEYYLQRDFADTIISSYLSILIAQLVRNYKVDMNKPMSKSQEIAVQMLKEINGNYKDTSLEKLSAKYDYNRNYLSNLFKKEVGDTFSNVLTKQRLINANILIKSTTLPVSKIIKEVGIKNRTFFYKKYISYYKMAPGSSRKENSN